ncbi:winged helix-turn-helix transcriptional regulator [Ochrobactrum sp. Q0168]|uniref:winged helix-turn-helix transcriptional regulator n=1 Tax=Ochrobactrum sp. Q0168 TaxID=2793241 RepID=UPI0018EA690F|nr:winged helix-turn-helix transcriptional regulator [Ochrobactrum sp. Q0168]
MFCGGSARSPGLRLENPDAFPKPIRRNAISDGTKRFGELRRLIGGITQRSLTLQLRELEESGVISREVFAEVPPRVEYTLTAFGETLTPVLLAMKEWGEDYIQKRHVAS